MNKLPLTSYDILGDKVSRIREEFPEVFSEGKIDFERLKAALGEFVDNERERYGLSWAGKSEAIQNLQTPSIGTLIPVPGESVNFDTTENLIIEGDNLEVLKLLQKSYRGAIKMIFIDPPYNTGNEFIYPDNFRDGLGDYLRLSGQVDDEGLKLSTNTETDGRYHSKWLNMMYPRLYLAKSLLKPSGLIFISIDENEEHNLKHLMNEIFGEENFVSAIRWEKKFTRSNNSKMFATLTETVLLYRRSEELDELKEPRNEKANSIYSNPDNDPRGPWTSVLYVNPATKEQRPNLVYPIQNPFSGEMVEHPTHAWKYSYETYEKHVSEGRLYWGKLGENKFPRLKKFLSEMDGGMVPVDLWEHEDTGTTDEGSKVMESLFGEKVFDFPKPPRLIQRMLSIATKPNDNDIVLDFFAGSGTTAQAVLDMNNQDSGNRRFILVQLPESTGRNDYPKISDITKERVRRVISKYQSQEKESLLSFEDGDKDLGFRFFKLDSSNFKIWDDAELATDANELANQLKLFADNIRSGRSQSDLLYEILLKSGFPLTAFIERIILGEQTVYRIDGGSLFICLEEKILAVTLTGMIESGARNIVCLDSAFQGDDNLKTNTKLMMESHDIEFRTV